MDWNSQVSEGETQSHTLLHRLPGGDKLGTACGGFDCLLFLGEPYDRGLVDDVDGVSQTLLSP